MRGTQESQDSSTTREHVRAKRFPSLAVSAHPSSSYVLGYRMGKLNQMVLLP